MSNTVRMRSTQRDQVLVTPPVPEPPGATPLWSDIVVEKVGVCYGGGYEGVANAVDFFTKTGIRYVRLGRVAATATTDRTTQRAIASALYSSAGVKGAIAICDDRDAPTIGDRVTECTTQWGGMPIKALEGPNEPQRPYASPSVWPSVVPTNGPTSSDTALGITEARRQMQGLSAVRGANRNLLCPMATKSKHSSGTTPGWWDQLGDLHLYCTDSNFHCYMGGQSMLKGGEVQAYILESQTSAGVGKNTFMTETGFHDFSSVPQPEHKHTPQSVQATYIGRGIVELALIPQLGTYCFYEAVDDDTLSGSYEGHFGLSTGMGSTVTLKSAGTSLARTMAIFADPGTPPTLVDLDITFTDGTGATNRKFAVFQKQDGTHLVAVWRQESVWTQGYPGVSRPVTDANVTIRVAPLRHVKAWRPRDSATATDMGVSGVYNGIYTRPIGADLTVFEIAP